MVVAYFFWATLYTVLQPYIAAVIEANKMLIKYDNDKTVSTIITASKTTKSWQRCGESIQKFTREKNYRNPNKLIINNQKISRVSNAILLPVWDFQNIGVW